MSCHGKEFIVPGEIVLIRTNITDVKDFGGNTPSADFAGHATAIDGNTACADFAGHAASKGVYLQLISSDKTEKTGEAKRGEEISFLLDESKDSKDVYKTYRVIFKWKAELGVPGALLVKNVLMPQFFLKSVTLSAVPDNLPQLRFFCDSWIFPYSVTRDASPRVFFSTKSHLPRETPAGLIALRAQELSSLRGSGSGERKYWERVYDYDVYNDLGNPDKSADLFRQALGGSHDFPYPRRCRTGRPSTETDCNSESLTEHSFFIPPDEKAPHLVPSDYRVEALNAYVKQMLPSSHMSDPDANFKSLEDVKNLYSVMNKPFPQVFETDKLAWMTDEEFARQTLSGINPMVIQCLQTFPSSGQFMDLELYGHQERSITAEHIEKHLDGLKVDVAVYEKRLFVVDYYDTFMPYIERINNQSDHHKMYASRMLFFLTDEGILKPVAIELYLPPTGDTEFVSSYTPSQEGEKGALWLLAKAHSAVNNAGYHQLISHWLRTHAVMEPFIIATHRQLSKMHPLHKLLLPHFAGTMQINASARQALINAGGIIESSYTPARYAIELSSKVYKDWKLKEQGLPADLLKRGMAVPDSSAPQGVRVVIEDYPYAVDGLEIWGALKQWVSDYLKLYYKSDCAIKEDTEVQAWWNEVVNVGHGDLKRESGWYRMQSVAEAAEAITTIIWVASAHHAAVNFGQYAYGGYMPNLPTTSSRLIPKKGTTKYEEMVNDPVGYMLESVSTVKQTVVVMGVLWLLSTHSRDEVYLGQMIGSTPDWTDDEGILDIFLPFTSAIKKVEKNVTARNANPKLKNRSGPAKVPYTFLYPSSEAGVTGMGVPNSVSI